MPVRPQSSSWGFSLLPFCPHHIVQFPVSFSFGLGAPLVVLGTESGLSAKHVTRPFAQSSWPLQLHFNQVKAPHKRVSQHTHTHAPLPTCWCGSAPVKRGTAFTGFLGRLLSSGGRPQHRAHGKATLAGPLAKDHGCHISCYNLEMLVWGVCLARGPPKFNPWHPV